MSSLSCGFGGLKEGDVCEPAEVASPRHHRQFLSGAWHSRHVDRKFPKVNRRLRDRWADDACNRICRVSRLRGRAISVAEEAVAGGLRPEEAGEDLWASGFRWMAGASGNRSRSQLHPQSLNPRRRNWSPPLLIPAPEAADFRTLRPIRTAHRPPDRRNPQTLQVSWGCLHRASDLVADEDRPSPCRPLPGRCLCGPVRSHI
jgi:hypothetical protein